MGGFKLFFPVEILHNSLEEYSKVLGRNFKFRLSPFNQAGESLNSFGILSKNSSVRPLSANSIRSKANFTVEFPRTHTVTTGSAEFGMAPVTTMFPIVTP